MQLVVISGLSGSGKSIALHVLEDANYFVVDNLPSPLLPEFVRQMREDGHERVAVAIDIRAGIGLAALPQQLRALQVQEGLDLILLFLTARDETLIARFSETRRRHPMGSDNVSLPEAIAQERDALEQIAQMGQHIDTSDLKPAALKTWVQTLLTIDPFQNLTLVFQSFGFKYGLPLDADLVFDVRCLPNPHYDPTLRSLTGQDAPVQAFLAAQPAAGTMVEDISRFVRTWLPHYMHDGRSYVTVAIGCTGGQHRSVYVAEQLAARFTDNSRVLVRHRALARHSTGG